MNHQILSIQFRRDLARLSEEVKYSVAMGHLDLNIICEDVICGLFRELYGFKKLRNLNNEEKKNFPGIDLADDEAKVAVQVTSIKKIEKIKACLRKVIKHNLQEKYDRVIFYILTEKQGSYSQASIDNVCQGKVEFDAARDILDSTDLSAKAANADLQSLNCAVKILNAFMNGDEKGVTSGVNIKDSNIQTINNIEKLYLNITSGENESKNSQPPEVNPKIQQSFAEYAKQELSKIISLRAFSQSYSQIWCMAA